MHLERRDPEGTPGCSGPAGSLHRTAQRSVLTAPAGPSFLRPLPLRGPLQQESSLPEFWHTRLLPACPPPGEGTSPWPQGSAGQPGDVPSVAAPGRAHHPDPDGTPGWRGRQPWPFDVSPEVSGAGRGRWQVRQRYEVQRQTGREGGLRGPQRSLPVHQSHTFLGDLAGGPQEHLCEGTSAAPRGTMTQELTLPEAEIWNPGQARPVALSPAGRPGGGRWLC